jgi:hypothetical protein
MDEQRKKHPHDKQRNKQVTMTHFVFLTKQTEKKKKTYNSFPSAGPALRTSEMAMDGSPFVKCGLSRPPETAMPNP